MRQVFLKVNVLLYLEKVEMMRQAAIVICEINLSVKPWWGRRDMKYIIWAFFALCLKSSLNFLWKMWKASVVVILYLTRKAEIRFISFLVFQFVFEDVDGGRVVFTFYGAPKGAEAADSDLISKFCWPNGLLILEMCNRFKLKRIKKGCCPWAKVGLAL